MVAQVFSRARRRIMAGGLAIGVVILLAVPSAALAVPHYTALTRPGHMRNWVPTASCHAPGSSCTATGSWGFTSGPPHPPMGLGSIKLQLGSEGRTVRSLVLPLTKPLLSKMLKLSVSDYLPADRPANVAPKLQLYLETPNYLYTKITYNLGKTRGSWVSHDTLADTSGWSISPTEFEAAHPGTRVIDAILTLGGTTSAGNQWVAFDKFRIAFGGVTNADVTWNFEPVTVNISGGSVTEGDSGTRHISFKIYLSATMSTAVTVHHATANGTARAPSDYVARSGTVTIAAGHSSVIVSVTVKGDTVVEPTEHFYVNLSDAHGAPIWAGSATGTIKNDD